MRKLIFNVVILWLSIVLLEENVKIVHSLKARLVQAVVNEELTTVVPVLLTDTGFVMFESNIFPSCDRKVNDTKTLCSVLDTDFLGFRDSSSAETNTSPSAPISGETKTPPVTK